MGMDQAPESRFGLRFSACGVLDLCHVRNVRKLDQVNCAKLKYSDFRPYKYSPLKNVRPKKIHP